MAGPMAEARRPMIAPERDALLRLMDDREAHALLQDAVLRTLDLAYSSPLWMASCEALAAHLEATGGADPGAYRVGRNPFTGRGKGELLTPVDGAYPGL